VAGVGQEDVAVVLLQADSNSEFVASVVPLHGCVVVKPVRTADSAATFAFVSPKTGKVYRTWSACLSATRPDQSRALSDSVNRATSTKAPVTRPPR
jgi:hypothetical protein